MRIAVFGPGGFGRELLRIARLQAAAHRAETTCEVVFVSDHPEGPVLGVPVISSAGLKSGDRLAIALGSGPARRGVEERLAGRELADLIAPTAVIGEDVRFGAGAVFCDFTMVTASAVIGRQFQCNIYSYVAHDCVIGDYVTFAPRVCCNGNVHVEDEAYIGTGAVLRQGTPEKPLVIGRGATVGMGAVVTKDVPAGVTVIGNPARPLER